MITLKLWVRLGDQGEYESFSSIGEAADEIANALGLEDDEPHVATRNNTGMYGINVGSFQGNDGISLYWGDGDAQFGVQITDDELEELNSTLAI